MKPFRESHIKGVLSFFRFRERAGINDPHLLNLWGEFRTAFTEASPSMQEA